MLPYLTPKVNTPSQKLRKFVFSQLWMKMYSHLFSPVHIHLPVHIKSKPRIHHCN